MPKDLFSNHAALYSKFRPTYPKELYDYIISFVETKNTAWDCATGNGQAAIALADYFKQVIATDISEDQIHNALQKENIHYQIAAAENTPFADNTFDLITVAQAYHWLNWKAFHTEASRVAKQNAVIAILAYDRTIFEEDDLNNLFEKFYNDITGPYWEPERKYVDEKYKTVVFNFESLPSKQFFSKVMWRREQFTGYLESWSAVQKYNRVNGSSPLLLINKELDNIWNDAEIKIVLFPIYLRIGRIRK